MPDRAFSSKSFILPTKGNIVKDYYAEELLKRGWIKGKNAKGEDFYIHTDKYDEFNFYKDGYTLTWSSSIPLDKDPNTIIWGTMEERRYVIVIKKA